MIQRYMVDLIGREIFTAPTGDFVMFADAEADKAEAVAEAVEKATKKLRDLLSRWITDVDAGNLDGVDLELMVESEAAIEPQDSRDSE